MRCREYIFLLTSEQLPAAALPVRLTAGWHRVICRRCRAFTANDARLDAWVRQAVDATLREDESGADTPPTP
ncbi:MAG: hypothetical protein LCH73_06790 [Proteobacteria bacterium]|nr:hypothetical protein [Pseudomonadota bacterium]